MSHDLPYQLLADAVLVLHVAIVAFVIGGLLGIFVGNRLGWRWVNALSFRLVHVGTVGIVVAEAWLGAVCPLTTFEMRLRAQAHASTYSGSFVAHWLQRLLYYDAPAWVFALIYSLFGLLVLASWLAYPPNPWPPSSKPQSGKH